LSGRYKRVVIDSKRYGGYLGVDLSEYDEGVNY